MFFINSCWVILYDFNIFFNDILSQDLNKTPIDHDQQPQNSNTNLFSDLEKEIELGFDGLTADEINVIEMKKMKFVYFTLFDVKYF